MLTVPLLLAMAIAHAGCADVPTAGSSVDPPDFRRGGGGNDGGADATLSVALSGTLSGADQSVSGRNDARTVAVKGDYLLTLGVDLATLECGDLPGKIPDEPGLVAFVQERTPAVGTLDIKYDKTAPDPGRIDSWTVAIGEYDYWVQFFRWASSELSEVNGATVVDFTGGSIVVFKKQGGKYVSREQCFGPYVDYDLAVR
jgi:hypothetical protein